MNQVDFENGSITSNILQTALPMMAAQILNLLYSIVDRIYIGRIPGEGTLALGSVGLCFPVIIMITAFTNLYGSGGAALCAMERGRGNTQKAAVIMNTAAFMLFATALILMALGEIFAPQILTVFGASPDNMSAALEYMRIYLLGTLFTMAAGGLNPYINAQGFPLAGMMTVLIGAVANIIIDPILIFFLSMGVRGAAVATVFSQMLSAAFAVSFLRGPRAELKIKIMSPDEFIRNLKTAGEIISLGTASFVMQFTNSLVQICCNSTLAFFGGSVYVSVMTLISSIRQIIDTPIMSLSEGASPVLSYNYGAGRGERVISTIRILTALGIFYTFFMWLLLRLFPNVFIGIFSNDREILKDAAGAMNIYFAAFVFQSLQYCAQTVFKALGKKKRAIFFSLLRKVVLVVPLTFLFPYVFHMGTNGVFLAEPVSNVIGGGASFITMLLTLMPELKNMESPKSG